MYTKANHRQTSENQRQGKHRENGERETTPHQQQKNNANGSIGSQGAQKEDLSQMLK